MAAAPLTVVVGAGISGLTCAYALKKSGQNVLLLEASARPGGVISSVEESGFLFELGPQSFSGTEAIFRLCDELEISNQLVEAPHRAPRYVLIDGKLIAVPLSPGAFLGTSLLSWRTKFSILTEVLRKSPPSRGDESVADFVRAKFTPELLDRLVGPFVSGIYAGDPERLSLRAAFPKLYEAQNLSGSVIRGSLRLAKKNQPESQSSRRSGLYSFLHGNATLIRALAGALGDSLRCGSSLSSTVRRDGNRFRLQLRSSAGPEEIFADKLVLASPTHVNSELLQTIAPATALPLRSVEYAPVTVVSHGYHKNQVGVDLDGFGFLIPRSQNLQTLGTVWNSSLFPGRAPANHVLITSFIGGACEPRTLGTPLEAAGTVCAETAKLLRITGSPAIERITGYSAAIPQYNLGHTDRLQAIRDAAGKVPGLWLAGNYWKGPAIGACIDHALAVAEAVRIG